MGSPPLVIFGLDGADPDLILGWAREGYLPTIASLLRAGASARLVGPEMISVHGVWTSFFSGVSLSQHGFYMRRPLKPGTYRLETIGPCDLDAPPFWSALRGRGKEVLIVDVPETRPQSGLSGFQLANWGNHPSGDPPASLPEGLLEEIHQLIGPPIKSDESQGGRWKDQRVLPRILRRVENKGALCRHLLAKRPFDLVVVVFGDSHAAGHRFRKYMAPTSSASATGGKLAQAVREIYQAIDHQIGLLLRQFPTPPNVFVVSNSGIHDGYPVGEVMDDFCRQLGYKTPIEATTSSQKVAALYRRAAASSWCSSLSRALPQPCRLHLEAERFVNGTDWSRTTAFAIPARYTGYLRVNLKGREPCGIVEAGSEYESLLDRLEEDLKRLVDQETAKPVIERITRTGKLFNGGPPHRLPDLVVDWGRCLRVPQRIVHPQAVLVRIKIGDPRGNYHSRTGLVIAAGPAIQQRGPIVDLSAVDFAPLFWSLLGQPMHDGEGGKAQAAFTG
jgi:predicted AlkP superfamily phosphohydrolase/phosphomutase